jgi:hypothetical protein
MLRIRISEVHMSGTCNVVDTETHSALAQASFSFSATTITRTTHPHIQENFVFPQLKQQEV